MPAKKCLSTQQRRQGTTSIRKTRVSKSSSTIEASSKINEILEKSGAPVKEKKKRARETTTPAPEASSTSSTLACAALNIVLQRMTIPNLDWSIKVFEARLPILRSQIIEDRMKLSENMLSVEEKDIVKTTLASSLENEVGFFDTNLIDILQIKLEEISFEELFNEMALERMTSEELTRAKAESKLLKNDDDSDYDSDYEDSDGIYYESGYRYYHVKHVKPAVERVVFSRYWSPIKHMLQHQIITIVKALLEDYLKLYHQVMEWFYDQQKRYGEVTSLVVRQLVSLEHCMSWLELLEFPLFSLAMTPLQLEKEHKRKLNDVINMSVGHKSKLILSDEDIVDILLDYLINECNEYQDNARVWLFKPVYGHFKDVINKIQERIQCQSKRIEQSHHQEADGRTDQRRYPKRIRKSSSRVIDALLLKEENPRWTIVLMVT